MRGSEWQFVKLTDDKRRHGGKNRPGSARPAQSIRGTWIQALFAYEHDEMLKSLSALASNSRLWRLRKVFRAWQPVLPCKFQTRWLSSSASGRQEQPLERGDEGDLHHEKTEHRYSHCWSILLNPSLTSVLLLAYLLRRNSS